LPGRAVNIWFSVVSVANLVVSAFMLLLVYALLLLAGIADGIRAWPYYAILASGFVLSILTWILGQQLPSKTRRFGLILNGSVSLICLAVIAAGVSWWLHGTRRLFRVPAGFQGDLYLVHDPWHGAPVSKRFGRTIYTFPSDGVLVVSDHAPSVSRDEYEYFYPNGNSSMIHDTGPGTLLDTPENRQNTREVITYFRRTLSYGGMEECPVEEITIGTRAFILARKVESPFPLGAHPGLCKH
jgi:hypothetical protein